MQTFNTVLLDMVRDSSLRVRNRHADMRHICVHTILLVKLPSFWFV